LDRRRLPGHSAPPTKHKGGAMDGAHLLVNWHFNHFDYGIRITAQIFFWPDCGFNFSKLHFRWGKPGRHNGEIKNCKCPKAGQQTRSEKVSRESAPGKLKQTPCICEYPSRMFPKHFPSWHKNSWHIPGHRVGKCRHFWWLKSN